MTDNNDSSALVDVCRAMDGMDAIKQARILRAARVLLDVDNRLREAERHLRAFDGHDNADDAIRDLEEIAQGPREDIDPNATKDPTT